MKKLLKKSTSLMLALIMLCSMMFSNTVFAANTPQINVTTANCYESTSAQSIAIDVSLANNPGITTMLLNLSYDNTYLKLTSVQDAGVFGTTVHGNNVNSMPYVLCWANDTAETNFVINEKIVTLNFEVAANAPKGTYPITLSYNNENDEILNVDLEPVYFEVNNGAIVINENRRRISQDFQ